MPDDIQLLDRAKHLAGQVTVPQQAAVPIFAALIIAEAIRVAGNKIVHAISSKTEK